MSASRIEATLKKEHKDIIERKAKELNMSVASYIVFCAVNANIEIRVGIDPEVTQTLAISKLLDDGKIDENEFKRLKFKVKNNCGRKEIEEYER